MQTAHFHLPGLFEFYDFYKVFLSLFYEHREWFYDWVDIASIYGAPADCLWGGGRVGFGEDNANDVLELLKKYGISGCLTFSNSLLREEHLADKKCNRLCSMFEKAVRTCEKVQSPGVEMQSPGVEMQSPGVEMQADVAKMQVPGVEAQSPGVEMQSLSVEMQADVAKMQSPGVEVQADVAKMQVPDAKKQANGIIVHSDLLLEYLKEKYPGLYFVSSTTKVITDFSEFITELNRPDFSYVVPDFRLNKQTEQLNPLSQNQKNKIEFLVNECCWTGCRNRKICYENVSRKSLGENCPDHICKAPGGSEGYFFSKAMQNPTFISRENIQNIYLPAGFSNFKIEGRSLGSAIILEMLLYYLTKPEFQLNVRENIYLDNMLNLF